MRVRSRAWTILATCLLMLGKTQVIDFAEAIGQYTG